MDKIMRADNVTEVLHPATNESTRDIRSHNVLQALVLIEVYCMPVICSLGIVGNTLSAVTFFKNPLRKTSCSIYLGVRSISDNGFLLALLLIWISSVFNLRLSRVTGVCQTVVFLTYICGCVSIWLVVFVTIETYVRMCHPFISKSVCAKRSACVLTATLCICSFGVYNFPLWISNPDCSHNKKFSAVTQALVYTDTLLTLVIPSLLITILMVAIMYNLIRTFQRRQRLNQTSKSKGGSGNDGVPAAKVTKMLFIVSLLYFVLNIPSHVIRLEILIDGFIKGRTNVSFVEKVMQTISQLLYYLSFSVNIIVYLKFGRNFRKTFRKTFCKIRIARNDTDCTEAVNMVTRSAHSKGRRSLTVVIGSKPTNYLTLPSTEVSTHASDLKQKSVVIETKTVW